MIYLALGTVFYLLGAFLTYFYFRYATKNEFGSWTVGDRMFAIYVSTASWLGLICSFFAFILSQDSDKPAKW